MLPPGNGTYPQIAQQLQASTTPMPVHFSSRSNILLATKRRGLAFGLALMSGAALQAMPLAVHAQTPQPYYTGKALGSDNVTVDLGALEKLGQPPSLPERLRGIGGVPVPPAAAPLGAGPVAIAPAPVEAPRSGLAVDLPAERPAAPARTESAPAAKQTASVATPKPVPAPAPAPKSGGHRVALGAATVALSVAAWLF